MGQVQASEDESLDPGFSTILFPRLTGEARAGRGRNSALCTNRPYGIIRAMKTVFLIVLLATTFAGCKSADDMADRSFPEIERWWK